MGGEKERGGEFLGGGWQDWVERFQSLASEDSLSDLHGGKKTKFSQMISF